MDKIVRRCIRAAVVICDQLHRTPTQPKIPPVPLDLWTNFTQAASRTELARRQKWLIAESVCEQQLRTNALRLRESLFDFCQQRVDTSPPVVLGELIADLQALDGEFDDSSIDLRGQTIQVTTELIELECLELGRFEIVLSYDQLSDCTTPYRVLALDPYLAHEDGCPHPHVQSEQLCAGEGQQAIRTALEQGRLLDFFLLVRQVLRNYNPDSAYTRLDQWHGVDCRDCGDRVEGDDVSGCEPCGAQLCRDCVISCEDCCQYCCDGCSHGCTDCEQVHCHGCLKACRECKQSFCESCLNSEHKPGVCDACCEKEKTEACQEPAEPPQRQPTTQAEATHATTVEVHTLRVGQAVLPA